MTTSGKKHSSDAWSRARGEARRVIREKTRADWLPDPTPIELAWAAGIIEGEGCITLSNCGREGRRAMCPYVVIGNTDLEMIQFFQSRWNGCLKEHNPVNPNARPAYDWRIGGWKAIAFLRQLFPYFRTARVIGKAEIVIEAYGLPSHDRGELAARIRQLNKRGLK